MVDFYKGSIWKLAIQIYVREHSNKVWKMDLKQGQLEVELWWMSDLNTFFKSKFFFTDIDLFKSKPLFA